MKWKLEKNVWLTGAVNMTGSSGQHQATPTLTDSCGVLYKPCLGSVFLPSLCFKLHFKASEVSNFSQFNKFLCGLCVFALRVGVPCCFSQLLPPLHSLLFPFLWIWPSNDVCVRAYITHTDGGGVWWVLLILVALTVFPLPARSLPLFLRLSLPMLFLFRFFA